MQFRAGSVILRGMWNEPYLETCCRSALHRVYLAGPGGRPCGVKDDACLERLERMGFVSRNGQGRFVATDAGLARHTREVLLHEGTLAPPRSSGS
ncbi:hypothetical protein AGA_1129 [Acetobacter ghanensis]|uniref:Uncharacterized protein n=2 Tax=Acetobacter ghanensis TaxID=431306 RepID=A0A0U5F3D1_9PROT|nr:hypothetical protein AA18895_1922 [Acetobacter ghanensis DSM 18895]CEF55066.1 hypothetical protein AGA_1129 [Acetobacter ghanensis]